MRNREKAILQSICDISHTCAITVNGESGAMILVTARNYIYEIRWTVYLSNNAHMQSIQT